MAKKFCAIGCPPGKNYFRFPSLETEATRRKCWLNFFDMEEPNKIDIYACERHFSSLQTNMWGIKRDAVPDVPVVHNSSNPLFKRKVRNLRNNVIVVTPRDPEFIIYRNKTGVFHQNLFDFASNMLTLPPLHPRPILQVPCIKSVSCSMSTQTETRLCGSVQISQYLNEFRLNCFYCSETFLLQNWLEFVDHIKDKHFEQEEAFKASKYLNADHDYTPIKTPPPLPTTKIINSLIITEPINIMPPPVVIDLTKETPSQPILEQPPATPSPPPLTPKLATVESNDKSLNLNLATKLIKLLDQTVLNPDFRRTEEDNIVVIKRKVVETLQSNFLSKIIAEEAKPTATSSSSDHMPVNKKPQMSSSNIPVSKFTRPLYTLNYGQQNVHSVRNTPKIIIRKYIRKRKPTTNDDSELPVQNVDVDMEEKPISSYLAQASANKKSKLVAKRIAQQAIKNITTFENVYQTVKTRPPKLLPSSVFYVKDMNSNKVTEMQTSNKTPLSRCLRRTSGLESVFTPLPIETLQQNPIELVFEYSPKDVIHYLLDNMKNFPVLWEFHDSPFDPIYSAAIGELCKRVNTKWSLNINLPKMRSSINRILKFYRYMLPCENIDNFIDYFDKCTLFLPTSVEEIPRARCLLCYVCYKKDSELRQHLIEKHEFLKWPFKCDHCPERFVDVDDYELHKNLPHYVEIFKCQECNKRFNRKGLYNKHKTVHERAIRRRSGVVLDNNRKKFKFTNTEKHVCDVCNKEFARESYLRYHKTFHGEKKYKCHLCPKAFFLNSYLRLHIMKHRKELNYICEVCGKCFLTVAHLNRHMRMHTGEKVTCNICNLKLCKSSLSRHLRLVHVALEGTIESTHRARNHHHNKYFRMKKAPVNRAKESGPRQYSCKICQLPFEGLKLLKDHNNQVHSNIERTPCKICGTKFRQRQNLKSHYREKHKLHVYQIYKLIEEEEDLDTVLSIKPEELDALSQAALNSSNMDTTIKKEDLFTSTSAAVDYFEPDKIHSNALQDEIMKAVEHIDKQEIKIDDEHSMHEFFSDLLRHP